MISTISIMKVRETFAFGETLNNSSQYRFPGRSCWAWNPCFNWDPKLTCGNNVSSISITDIIYMLSGKLPHGHLSMGTLAWRRRAPIVGLSSIDHARLTTRRLTQLTWYISNIIYKFADRSLWYFARTLSIGILPSMYSIQVIARCSIVSYEIKH